MNITFLDKEQDYQNETTRYWFDVDGVSYCIADCNGDLDLLDAEGYPIDECNDHKNIKYELSHFVQKHQ